MRLGFDLHDGPIQDVLALAADVQLLQRQVYPFILDDYRDQAHGRFDDLSSRLVELDRQLREIAHSLETKSVISRPLGEILHREVDNFSERTGIAAELEIRGDPDSLSSAQRITVFRAIQEALANVREHAGATTVSVRVRARRSAIELQIVDDGMGFEVERALAKAAQRGRLGLVGIGERVHMVGGTFEVESSPGGPSSLKITLPRWEPLTPSEARLRRASLHPEQRPARERGGFRDSRDLTPLLGVVVCGQRRRRPPDLLRLFPLPPQPVPPPLLRILVRSAQPVVAFFASFETHLPKAFALFAFVPYLVLKGSTPRVARSALHFLAAFSRASCCSASSSSSSPAFFAVPETHLPKAFALFAFVPYLSLNASTPMLARSALHFFEAFLSAD